MKIYIKAVILIMFSLLSSQTNAQDEFTHLYILLNGKDSTNFELNFGEIISNEEFHPTKFQNDGIESIEHFTEIITNEMKGENTSDVLNIFIHGIWGDTKFAWEQMVKNVTRDTYVNGDGKKKVIVSIIWDSSIDYQKGVAIARRKGDFLSPFLKEVVKSNNSKWRINFLCHSMGNRIFQHMINELDLIEAGEKIIDQYICAGADIESNIFEEGQPLHHLEHIVNEITIYRHNNDRSLKMSKLLNKSNRLGLDGVPDISKLPDSYRIIDVSMIIDHDDIPSRMSNHRYFYMSPTVRKDLQRVIWEKDFTTSKQEMKHPRRLKLVESKKN